jgi:hypothetical protein
MSIFDRGVLMLDEVDLILHPLRSELNWPLGKRLPLDFTSEKHALGMRWELPLHLLDPLHYAGYGECVMQVPRSRRSEQLLQRIKCAVDRGCEERAMTRQPHLQLLEPRFYEDHLRPLLALWLLLYIVKLGVKSLDEEEMRAWIEHGQPPRKGKATALERDAWQVGIRTVKVNLKPAPLERSQVRMHPGLTPTASSLFTRPLLLPLHLPRHTAHQHAIYI